MIKLWENTPYSNHEYDQEEPSLTPYLIDKKESPCVIVCPGGGYHHRAYHEGEPVARWLNTLGYSAFVLNYRLAPYTYKAIIGDVLRAVRFVRFNGAAYNVNPDKIVTLGFSAGAHLASCAALYYDMAELDKNDPVDKMSSRADAAVLCYPVISFRDEIANMGSRKNFLGEEWADIKLAESFSGELNVTEDTPPMFLWHTSNDAAVPVENSLRLGEALHRKGVLFELHVYPDGPHGLGLANDENHRNKRAAEWTENCARWLAGLFD